MTEVRGVSAAAGIVMGRVRRLEKKAWVVDRILVEDLHGEIRHFKWALEKSQDELAALAEQTTLRLGEAEGAIFLAHKMMLEDPELIDTVEQGILGEGVCAAYLADTTLDQYIQMFEKQENEYFRQRAADLKDVRQRLVGHLINVDEQQTAQCLDIIEPVEWNIDAQHNEGLCPGWIYVASDISPSDMAELDPALIRGFATEKGGITSHFAIMASAMGIPTVIQLEGLMAQVEDGDHVVLDALGPEGAVWLRPSENEMTVFFKKLTAYSEHKKMLESYKGRVSVTRDGHPVELACNIGTASDCESVLKNDGEGIGLFRTEFLFFDRDNMPAEEEQYQVYKEVLEHMGGRKVVIRTMDAGGDKEIGCLKLPKEENPFLGYRAIRICLEEKAIFKTQLRAILRASVHGKAAVMFPMVAALSELRAVKLLMSEVREELELEGIAYDKDLEIGIMVEIPATAIMADRFAKEVDFFSIGTNDLTQYTVAVDRGNEKIAHLYSAYHPAVLRLIKRTIDCGLAEGKWVGICGESAGDPLLQPLFVAMGISELSMSSSKILPSRQRLLEMDRRALVPAVEDILNLDTAEAVVEKLKAL